MIITYTLVGLVALVAIVVALRLRRRKPSADAISEARKRAEDRIHTRAFADTTPEFDPYRTSLQFQTTVLPVAYLPEITETQAETISVMLGTKTSSWYQGTGPENQFAATGFDVTETIELHDPWKNVRD